MDTTSAGDPQRFRLIVNVEVEVTDRTALDAAALQWHQELYTQTAAAAAQSLMSLYVTIGGLDEQGEPRRPEGPLPGARVLSGSVLPWLPDGAVYPAVTLPELPAV